MYMENNPAILSQEPDVIIHQPVTTQPSVNSFDSSGPWSYSPCGSAPLGRTAIHGAVANIPTQNKPNPLTQCKDKTSISNYTGSRDWSKDLFDSFKEVHKSKQKCSSFAKLCGDCLRLPCTMSNIASSLGDKGYLPFIPGTGAAIRFKVRILGGIHGTIANDCLVTSCCCPCATCQMYREIEEIGL